MDIKGPAYLIDNWGELIIFVIYQNKHYMLELLISFLQRISIFSNISTFSMQDQTSTKKLQGKC